MPLQPSTMPSRTRATADANAQAGSKGRALPKRLKCTAAVATAIGGTQRRSPQLSDIEEALDDTFDEAFDEEPWPQGAEHGGGFLRLPDGPSAHTLFVGATP